MDLKARKYLKELDLKEIFKKYDPDNDGFMAVIKFKYVLHNELGMSVEEVERIVNYFKEDKEGRNIVNYSYFLDVDWYVEELRRLEEEMKKDAGKYKKLYTHKNMSAKKRIQQPIAPASSYLRAGQDDKGLRKIYNVNLRFSQQPLEQQQQELQHSRTREP